MQDQPIPDPFPDLPQPPLPGTPPPDNDEPPVREPGGDRPLELPDERDPGPIKLPERPDPDVGDPAPPI